MEYAATAGRRFDVCWFLLCAALSSVWCTTAARQLSATFDEPFYIAQGLEFWRTGSHHGLLKKGTMPLPIDVATLPLFLWERSHGSPINVEADLEAFLPWARGAELAFWWLLLFYVLRMGRELGGPWGGRLAVALLAVEPTFLAHAGLATTDIAVTACLVALAYHFRRGREAGWLLRVGVPALWYGLAVLAKASGMVFGPLLLATLEVERLVRAGTLRIAPLKQAFRDLLTLSCLGMVLVLVYCGSDWKPEPSFVAWAQRLPEGPFAAAMVWLSENLCIFSNGGEALVRQIKHNMQGHDGSYLLGVGHTRPCWYYFPVALTMKLSTPLLVLASLLLAARPRHFLTWVGACAGVLLLFSLNCRVQIGIRLVLPLAAFLIVTVAVAAARTASELVGGWRTTLRYALGGGLGWSTVSALLVWPNGLCFTNELWGGTADGYRCLSDSNYDWGQGLKELARWQEKAGADDLEVWYFGTDPALSRLPMHELKLHLMPIARPEDVLERVRGHRLAVSTTILHGQIKTTPALEVAAAFLRTREPVARTSTYFIYDFREPGTVATGNPVGHSRR